MGKISYHFDRGICVAVHLDASQGCYKCSLFFAHSGEGMDWFACGSTEVYADAEDFIERFVRAQITEHHGSLYGPGTGFLRESTWEPVVVDGVQPACFLRRESGSAACVHCGRALDSHSTIVVDGVVSYQCIVFAPESWYLRASRGTPVLKAFAPEGALMRVACSGTDRVLDGWAYELVATVERSVPFRAALRKVRLPSIDSAELLSGRDYPYPTLLYGEMARARGSRSRGPSPE
jgi:hypothetical protein